MILWRLSMQGLVYEDGGLAYFLPDRFIDETGLAKQLVEFSKSLNIRDIFEEGNKWYFLCAKGNENFTILSENEIKDKFKCYLNEKFWSNDGFKLYAYYAFVNEEDLLSIFSNVDNWTDEEY